MERFTARFLRESSLAFHCETQRKLFVKLCFAHFKHFRNVQDAVAEAEKDFESLAPPVRDWEAEEMETEEMELERELRNIVLDSADGHWSFDI